MILTSLPQLAQVSIYPRAPSLDAAHQFTLSILKTRFNRIAQVIEAVFQQGSGRPHQPSGISAFCPVWPVFKRLNAMASAMCSG
jgi:hypothetical protein